MSVNLRIKFDNKQRSIKNQMRPIEPLTLKGQNYQNKQNQSSPSVLRQTNQFGSFSHGHKTAQTTRQNAITQFKQNQISKRIKTSQYSLQNRIQQQFIKTFNNVSQELIKTHKPFLENKRIIFNVKNRKKGNFLQKQSQNEFVQVKGPLRESNIQRLKKQIMQLDKEDFVSYRSKGFFNSQEIKLIDNEKINKYNYQNSMIVQWKGKIFQKPHTLRPSSTLGILDNCPPAGALFGPTNTSSVARKYFAKAKKKNLQSNTGQFCASQNNIVLKAKPKLKTQQIAIGLNMFRGKMHRNKVNSSFHIHC